MRRLLALLLLFTSGLFADSYLSLRGYLGSEDIPSLNEQIGEIEKHERNGVVIHVSSSSGNLQDVFDIARKLYQVKQSKQLKFVVFIEERAVGPAAIIPFLADELYVTPICVWGDIPYGVNQFIGRDLMRRAIKELVSSPRPVYDKLIDAMIDPHYKITGIQEESFQPIVLNVAAMEKLKLVSGVTTRQQFLKLYPGLEEGQFDVISSEALQNLFEKEINVYPTGPNYFGYLRFDGKQVIDASSYLYFKYALEYYRKKNVQAVLLHLDSPGGAVLPALKMTELLEEMDVKYRIPVICFIDNWALASAAMLPYATRFIGITNQAEMGAMTKQVSEETGMKPISNQVNKVLRSEFKELASFYGRPTLVAEAMVDKNILIVIRDDKLVQLNSPSEILPTDQILTKQGQPLTMNADHLLHSSTAQFLVEPMLLPPVTKEERQEGQWPASKMLVFQQPYLKTIPHSVIISYHGYKLPFYQILIKPYVGGLLIMGLLIGLYMQLTTRRFSFASLVALACLILILLVSFAIHFVGWIELIIMITGLLLILVELFVLPGYRVAGIFGAILLILGVMVMLIPGIEHIEFTNIDSLRLLGGVALVHFVYLLAGVLLSLGVIYLLARYQGRTLISSVPFEEKIDRAPSEGASSTIPQVEEGATGETYTKLDPRGQVLIGAHLYNAITEKGEIERGEAITVIKVHAHTLVVRHLK